MLERARHFQVRRWHLTPLARRQAVTCARSTLWSRRNGLTTLPPMDSGFAQLTKLAASGNRLRGDAVLENLAGLAQ